MPKNDLSRSVKEFIQPVETTLNVDHTIHEALESLRERKIEGKIVYFYVIDHSGKLEGVVSTRKLLLNDQKLKIRDVMIDTVASLNESHNLKDAMELLSKHELLAVPVVDGNQKLSGIIDIQLYLDDSVDIANARHRTDMFQILGLTMQEGNSNTPWKSYRIRMPWIVCNMAGGIGCAIISRFFEPVLSKVILLAMFIPLILTLSESISMQSMTQTLQLARKKLSFKKIVQRVLIETRMVNLLSLTCGITVGLLSLLWGGGVYPALTIAVSIALSVSISASVGAAVPLILYARSLDPKVASGPVVLMFADILTTAIYLSLGTWWLL